MIFNMSHKFYAARASPSSRTRGNQGKVPISAMLACKSLDSLRGWIPSGAGFPQGLLPASYNHPHGHHCCCHQATRRSQSTWQHAGVAPSFLSLHQSCVPLQPPERRGVGPPRSFAGAQSVLAVADSGDRGAEL